MNNNGFGFLVGASQQSGKEIYAHTDRHGMVVGATGSGKTSLLAAIILAWVKAGGSLVVIGDVMSELSLICADACRKYCKVLLNDPYKTFPDELGHLPHVGYNPLASLNDESDDFASKAMGVASGCVTRDSHTRDKYWDNSSLSLVQAIIMAEVMLETAPSLARVCEIISGDVFAYAKAVCQRCTNWTVQNKMRRYLTAREDEVKSIREVIENSRTQMGFCLNPAVAENMSRDDYRYAWCKQEQVAIFNILPHYLMMLDPEMSKYFRLHLNCSLGELFDHRNIGSRRTLVVCEEYYQIAHGGLDAVVRALAVGRKYKTQLLLAVNGLSELKDLHPNFEPILNNMGFTVWLEANDLTSSRYLSDLCGDREITAASVSAGQRGMSTSLSMRDHKLIMPHEVRSLSYAKEQIVFMDGVPGRGPLRLNRRSYRDIPELLAMAGKNPYYGV